MERGRALPKGSALISVFPPLTADFRGKLPSGLYCPIKQQLLGGTATSLCELLLLKKNLQYQRISPVNIRENPR